MECIGLKRIGEVIWEVWGENISEGRVEKIVKENRGKGDSG